MAARKPIIGLAGGIGSGKSWVAGQMQAAGAFVLNADALAHEALDQPDIQGKLTEWWGPDAVSSQGQVNRSWIAAKIFSDAREKQRLEELIHPWVKSRMTGLILEAQANPACRAVVLDVPLLFEVGWDKECDRIVYVEADRATRLKRVRQRGWDAAELDRREKNQGALDKKKAFAHYSMVNSDDEVSSSEQVRNLLDRILSELSDRPAP